MYDTPWAVPATDPNLASSWHEPKSTSMLSCYICERSSSPLLSLNKSFAMAFQRPWQIRTSRWSARRDSSLIQLCITSGTSNRPPHPLGHFGSARHKIAQDEVLSVEGRLHDGMCRRRRFLFLRTGTFMGGGGWFGLRIDHLLSRPFVSCHLAICLDSLTLVFDWGTMGRGRGMSGLGGGSVGTFLYAVLLMFT